MPRFTVQIAAKMRRVDYVTLDADDSDQAARFAIAYADGGEFAKTIKIVDYSTGTAEIDDFACDYGFDLCDVELCDVEDAEGKEAALAAQAPDPAFNDLVSHRAPQWAWDIFFETLAMDCRATSFDAELRAQIADALAAIEAGT